MTENEKQIQSILTAVSAMEVTQEFVLEAQKVTTAQISNLTESIVAVANVNTKIKSTNLRVDDLEEENKEGIRPKTLKHMLSASLIVLVAFGSWITLYTFSLDKNTSNHIVGYETEIEIIKDDIKTLEKKTNHNKNQNTWVKGQINGLKG